MPDSKLPAAFMRRIRSRAADWRPGIALQLGIAFVGVAALAAVANFAVQRSISITTTRVVATAAAAARQHGGPLRAPDMPVPAERNGKAALPALERLSSAVLSARLLPAADRQARAATAAREVRATLRRLHGDAQRADAALRAGTRIIELEARRDATYAQYAQQLVRIEQRMQEPLDQAWRILGRVVARQSVVVADQRIAEMRREASVMRTPDYTAADLARLEMLEVQFNDALVAGQRTFTRSQGAQWYAETSADAAGFGQLRGSIVALDAERRQLLPQFRAELALVQSLLHSPATVKPAAPPAGTPVVLPEELVRRPLVMPPPWESPLQSTTRQHTVDEGIAPAWLAWLSGSVLALLLAVSVFTVLSILRPVQRLIAATQRIALGEAGVRVPRARSHELDRLATAFNAMAAQLETAQSMARDYRQQLEARVVERTRQLQHQADHDALTHLPNRRQLFGRLRGMLAGCADSSRRVGLFFIDLDNFKNINDGRGHGFGDRVLVAIAERLAAAVGDRGVAARFGGDEFTVVIEADGGDAALPEFGWSLVRAFQQPLRLDGRELLVSISVGAAFFPEHGRDAESLLRAADAALFRAKAQGRGRLALFTPDLLEQASMRFSTEQGLRRAVERGEFELAFQPEIDLARREVTVCEALLRWRRADGQLVTPEAFLTVAEESGLIVEISDWVLRAAITAAARWRQHEALREVRVAINVSSRQLADAAFAERVGALLGEHGLPPAALEIELTETVLQTGESTVQGLRRLQQMGITVALDDFGTGYSSLASLQQLPLGRVKLDRSLIAGIDAAGGRASSIAHAIINLCRNLGVPVTAEGVERPAQLAMLGDAGVTVQGFLLSRPVAEDCLATAIARMPELLQSLLPAERAVADVLHLQDLDLRRRRSGAGGTEG